VEKKRHPERIERERADMVEEVEQRKEKLKAELKQIEYQLESHLKDGLTSLGGFLPTGTIRRTPLRSVAIAAAVGFTTGLTGFRRRKRGVVQGLFRSTIIHMVVDELKRIAARRTFHYLMNLVDTSIHERFGRGGKENMDSSES